MTADSRCVFLVLGVTADWLMDRQQRLEFNKLVVCQIDSLPLLFFNLDFLYLLCSFGVFRPLLAIGYAQRNTCRLGLLGELV